ncbi:MAG: hypothetical protein QOJ33_1683 [Chloroflexota bacterium]|jgi:hypothetical protein|nr:hypothetical protein [Chloroflexota bacterium]MEA2668749.1 hypothetical protein [Chloroflexota bacterium]
MQAMPGVQGVASGRVLSAGAMLVFGTGLALFQLTSLLLGPVSSRQLDFSLTIPTVEGQDLSELAAPTVPVVVGSGATPAAHALQVPTSPRGVSLAVITASSQPLPLPSPSGVAGEGRDAGSHPTGKKPHRHR